MSSPYTSDALGEYRKKYAELHQRIFKNLHHCIKCKYFTKSTFCLQHHLKNHKTEYRRFNCQDSTPEEYFCTECEFSTNLKAYFKQHIAEYHLKKENEAKLVLKTYKCEGCSFLTYSSLVLLKHQSTKICDGSTTKKTKQNVTYVLEDGVKLYICYHCSYRTKFKSALRSHILSKHTPSDRIRWFKCNQCDLKAKSKGNLDQHVLLRHSELVKWHNCDHCEYRTKYLRLLKRHIYSKHTHDVDVVLHHCDRCNYTTPNPYNLKRHLYSKHSYDIGIKIHHCDNCEYRTGSSLSLKRHKTNKHKFDIVFHQCTSCDYKTLDKRYLKIHIQRKHTHCKEKEWLSCTQCEYKTLKRQNFYKHKLTHTVPHQRKYKCSQCEYCTGSNYQLKQHILCRHTDDENINWVFCDQCEYKCKTKSVLAKHLVTHSSLKQFQCHQCDHKCKRSSDLKIHMLRKHSEEKNVEWLSCDLCEFQCKTRDKMAQHSLKHSSGQFQCRECDCKFEMLSDFRKHVLRRHSFKLSQ